MFTLLGGGTAAVLSSLTFLGVNFTIGENSPAFMQWGWRIPFLISAALIGIALYVRLRIDETPVFVEEKARNLVPGADRGVVALAAPGDPVGRRQHPGRFGLRLYGEHLSHHVRPFPTRLHPQLHLGRRRAGRVGQHRVRRALGHPVRPSRPSPDDAAGLGGCVPWALVVMPLMDTGNPALYAVAIVGMFAIAAIGSGPTGAFIPELFATRYRYSGSALAVNLAGVVGGALPPLIAGTLQATYGSWAIGPMLAILALASFVCTYLLPETKGTALQSTQNTDGPPAHPELELS